MANIRTWDAFLTSLICVLNVCLRDGWFSSEMFFWTWTGNVCQSNGLLQLLLMLSVK